MGLVLVNRSATAPANPYDGQLWVDTAGTGTVVKVYNAEAEGWLVLTPLAPTATLASGVQQDAITDLNVAYTEGDLNVEAKIIAAINATNGAINDILAVLREFELIKTTA
jgi:hypothetical protein